MNGQITTAIQRLETTLGLSSEEELVNSFTHGLGFVLSLWRAFVMADTLGDGDGWRVAGCSIFVTSLIGRLRDVDPVARVPHLAAADAVPGARPRHDLLADRRHLHAVLARVPARRRRGGFCSERSGPSPCMASCRRRSSPIASRTFRCGPAWCWAHCRSWRFRRCSRMLPLAALGWMMLAWPATRWAWCSG